MTKSKSSDLLGQAIIAAIAKFEENLQTQKKAYDENVNASKMAPGAMESHSDTSKETLARMAETISEKIIETEKAIKYFKTQSQNCRLITHNDKTILLCDIPGGTKFKVGDQEIILVSRESPLGQTLR